MAKKSKIAKNEQRKEIVAAYVTVTLPMAAHAVTSASSACPVSVCAAWLTVVSCRAFVSPAGKGVIAQWLISAITKRSSVWSRAVAQRRTL